jgi:hypothetical protein
MKVADVEVQVEDCDVLAIVVALVPPTSGLPSCVEGSQETPMHVFRE